VSAVQCWLLRAGVSISWVVRSIVAVAVVAPVMQVWHKAATHGYIVQPVTQECNPELRGETGDLVLHVRATGDMNLNHESIQLRILGARLHDIYEVRRTQKFLDEPLPGPLYPSNYETFNSTSSVSRCYFWTLTRNFRSKRLST
jgi:hypothetical protein